MLRKISDYIDDVRARSEEAKQRAVFFWTIVLIIVIFLIWVITFSLSVANRNAEELRLQQEAQETARIKEQESILATSTVPEESKPIKGLIPQGVELVGQGVDAVVNGFWVIGNMMHK